MRIYYQPNESMDLTLEQFQVAELLGLIKKFIIANPENEFSKDYEMTYWSIFYQLDKLQNHG